MTSPLLDTAARADSTSSIGTASDGGTWTVVTGTWGILSNHIYRPTGSSASYDGTHDAIWRDLGSASQDVQVDSLRSSSSGDAILAFAGASDNSHYALRFDSGVGGVVERITAAGAVGETVIANAGLASWSTTTTTLRVTYDSATGAISVYQGGALKSSGTASTLLTGTRVVLGTKTTAGTADNWANFSAYTLGTRPSGPAAPYRQHITVPRRPPLSRASVI